MHKLFYLPIVMLLISSCNDSGINKSRPESTALNEAFEENKISTCYIEKAQLINFFAYNFKEQVVDSLSGDEASTVKLYVYDLTEKYSDSLSLTRVGNIMDISRDSAYAFYRNIGSVNPSSILLLDKDFNLAKPYKHIDSSVWLRVKIIYVSEECNKAVAYVEEGIGPEWGSGKFYELSLDKEKGWKVERERIVFIS